MATASRNALLMFLVAIVLACTAPALAFAADPQCPDATDATASERPGNAAEAENGLVKDQESAKQDGDLAGATDSEDKNGAAKANSAGAPPAGNAPLTGRSPDIAGNPQSADADPKLSDDLAIIAASTAAPNGASTDTPASQGVPSDNVIGAASVQREPAKAAPGVTYQAHVQNIGWQSAVSNGGTAGTSGQSLRMEALKVTLNLGGYSGGLQMKAHVQNIGWQNALGNGGTMGTIGQSLRMEALRLALTGEVSQHFDIYYRAHVQNEGWQDWVSNGAIAGTTGKSLRVEALEVELRAKKAPTSAGDGLVGVRYQAHVQNIGWQAQQADGATAGTSGQSLRTEAVRIWLEAGALSGNIEYRAHVQNHGWMDWVKNGQIAGTTGKSLRLEAIEIRLTDSVADRYDVVYSTHVQNIGWEPAKNNARTSGSTGQGLRLEALTVQIVSKEQRNGWFKNGSTWGYYTSGRKATGRWLVTTDSPIDVNPGQQRYWVDTNGNLAVSRAIDPSNAADRGSYLSYATGSGYVKRNVIVEFGSDFYWANNDGQLTTPDVSSLIEHAVQWAINTANDDSHGYSQEVRWGPDYDCSSFVISAFKSAGFNVGDAVYTGNMVSEMTKHGFVWSTNLANLRRGDIVLVHNSNRQHTELYLGNGKLVGAHIAETGRVTGRAGDQTGNEISIGNYYNAPWQGFLRAVLR